MQFDSLLLDIMIHFHPYPIFIVVLVSKYTY